MTPVELEQRLVSDIASFRHDPLGFVLFAFPWGKAGTPLEGRAGPQMWQAQELAALGHDVRTNKKTRRAIASGKGIGKSALIAMTTMWGLCTFPDTRIRITAGTESQLSSTTMPEIGKWFGMLICKHWFKFTATSIYANDPDVERQKAYRLDAIPWNEKNPEAFAGLHNFGKRIVYLFDEASQIADPIWDTSDGIFSDADTEVIQLAYGNPTRGIGRFKEAFDRPFPAGKWKVKNIDSRTVEITDKAEIAATIAELGEDHDVVRWSIRGLFPSAATTQFISTDVVKAARKAEPISTLTDPCILGVDVARFGADSSVLAVRKGRDARSIPWRRLAGADTVQVARAVQEMHTMYQFDAIFVDGGGVGGGVIDTLRSWNIPVIEVQFGAKSDIVPSPINPARYANKRSEIWGTMKEGLKTLALPDDDRLERQLTSALYGYRNDKEIALVPKEIMRRQHGVESPDDADALALTFAHPVQKVPHGVGGGVNKLGTTGNTQALTEYDPFA
jgi:hypothetical protein